MLFFNGRAIGGVGNQDRLSEVLGGLTRIDSKLGLKAMKFSSEVIELRGAHVLGARLRQELFIRCDGLLNDFFHNAYFLQNKNNKWIRRTGYANGLYLQALEQTTIHSGRL